MNLMITFNFLVKDFTTLQSFFAASSRESGPKTTMNEQGTILNTTYKKMNMKINIDIDININIDIMNMEINIDIDININIDINIHSL